ncbi:hypothetical protein D1BOALGB6SA_913 [Olavius sp. associated proteobacterium Delta 1]|nr:hypothetical protein D1BOALGB6SA_913 [Olavius sp. associated proteobacterium Delta 1]
MTLKYEHTLLCVDDERSILNALKRLLRRRGFKILAAEGGSAGLEVLTETDATVSLIISDQRMPEMTGAEFLEQSKSIAPDAIRFLLTGYSDMNAVVAAINKGEIHRYLTKPWNDDDLVLQVEQSLQQYELVLENRRLTELTNKQNHLLTELNQDLEKKVEERTREIVQKNKTLEDANLKLEKSLFDTIRLMSVIIENFNPKLGNYMKNVTLLSRKVAEEFKVAESGLQTIEMAAMVHDIGLLEVPRSLWQKDEKEMTSQELAVFYHHPVIASLCLESVERLSEVAEIVLYHHERFDGRGYPEGIRSTNIPLGARIIAVTGDYVRLMNEWPESLLKVHYKAQGLLGPEAKVLMGSDRETIIRKVKQNFLRQRSGSMYDPDVVKKVIKVLQISQDGTRDSGPKFKPVHIDDLKIGMTLCGELRTVDGRLVLPADSVLTKMSIIGINRLANDRAIGETVKVRL